MNDQDIVETKKGFFQNDRLLVCSMLAFYGICILGLIGGTFMWLGKRNETISANATSTAFAVATQQANSTATAVVRATEQAGYEFTDRFDTEYKYYWRVGVEDDEYYKGNIKVGNGAYIWDIKEVYKTFVDEASFNQDKYIQDFDVYIDTKILDAAPGNACSGLKFRASHHDWEDEGYYYELCSDSLAYISYYNYKDGWETIAEELYVWNTDEWNRMEIVARGSYYQLLVNGQLIYEMNDDRLKGGGVALTVELDEKAPATILFDNFGLQRR